MKVFVAYDSKYGNTKLVAEQILEGIKEAGEFETAICYAKEIDLQKIADYDVIVIGAPNHMGKPSRAIGKFMDDLSKVQLKTKWAAVFDTYFAKPKNYGKAMKKMEQTIAKNFPSLKLIVPGLSIMVKGVNGPIVDGELPKCKDFGRQIANQLKTLSP